MNADDTASVLLGVESFAALARSNLERCILADGRFEAGRFGLNQHSSAAAGAILNGVACLPIISPVERETVTAAGFALLTEDGSLRGHDREPADGVTSWSMSQVLLGLVRLGGSGITVFDRFKAGVVRLLQYQSPDGGWFLRHGDISDTSLAFYPTLRIARLLAGGDHFSEQIESAARSSLAYLIEVQGDATAPLVDRVLAHTAARQSSLWRLATRSQRRAITDGRATLVASLVGSSGRTTVVDKMIHNELQPRWHSVTWAPLLYLCTRRLVAPTHPVNLQLAARLIAAFDTGERSWRAPSHKDGAGSSWATSLALRNVYQLAEDLSASGVSAPEYESLMVRESVAAEFDVVISFGGGDRKVAAQIRDRLVAAGLRVFYDEDYQHQLLGEDLAVLLQDIYFSRSRFAVAVLSKGFLDSTWAGNWEWKAVLARMQMERSGYVLPYFLEDVAVPGLNPTIGYLSAKKYSPKQFADTVIAKIRDAGE